MTATKSGDTPRLSTWKTIPPGECRLGRDIHGFLPRHPSFVNLVAVTFHLCQYYPGNKEGHIPTQSASEGPMKSSESRRGSPLDD